MFAGQKPPRHFHPSDKASNKQPLPCFGNKLKCIGVLALSGRSQPRVGCISTKAPAIKTPSEIFCRAYNNALTERNKQAPMICSICNYHTIKQEKRQQFTDKFFCFLKILSFYHIISQKMTMRYKKMGLKNPSECFIWNLSGIFNVSRETLNIV